MINVPDSLIVQKDRARAVILPCRAHCRPVSHRSHPGDLMWPPDWIQATRAGDGWRLAIDGKSAWAQTAAGGRVRPHLLGAAIHDGVIILAQRQIPD